MEDDDSDDVAVGVAVMMLVSFTWVRADPNNDPDEVDSSCG